MMSSVVYRVEFLLVNWRHGGKRLIMNEYLCPTHPFPSGKTWQTFQYCMLSILNLCLCLGKFKVLSQFGLHPWVPLYLAAPWYWSELWKKFDYILSICVELKRTVLLTTWWSCGQKNSWYFLQFTSIIFSRQEQRHSQLFLETNPSELYITNLIPNSKAGTNVHTTYSNLLPPHMFWEADICFGKLSSWL